AENGEVAAGGAPQRDCATCDRGGGLTGVGCDRGCTATDHSILYAAGEIDGIQKVANGSGRLRSSAEIDNRIAAVVGGDVAADAIAGRRGGRGWNCCGSERDG